MMSRPALLNIATLHRNQSHDLHKSCDTSLQLDYSQLWKFMCKSTAPISLSHVKMEKCPNPHHDKYNFPNQTEYKAWLNNNVLAMVYIPDLSGRFLSRFESLEFDTTETCV